MIKQACRVPRLSIPAILSKGEEYRSQFFIVRYRKNLEQFFRFRVIVSKKIEKSAVKRNHLRRQIYETIRLNAEPQSENRDCILIPKKNIPKNNYQDIQLDIKKLFNPHG